MILGTGIDLVELSRVKRLLQDKPRFSDRILTAEEKQQLQRLSPSRQVEYVAGRFSAKEALAKALGCGVGRRFTWQHVSILNQEGGAPEIKWHHPVDGLEIELLETHLSISHSRHYVVSQVIIER